MKSLFEVSLWGLTAGLTGALMDLVFSAHTQGVRLASAQAVATPAFILVGLCALLALAGALPPKSLVVRLGGNSFRVGAAMAGPGAVLIWVAGARTPAWALSPMKESLLWMGLAIVSGVAVGLCARTIRRTPGLSAFVERVFFASPLAMGLLFAIQGLKSPGESPAPFAILALVGVLGLGLTLLSARTPLKSSRRLTGPYLAAVVALAMISGFGAGPPPLIIDPPSPSEARQAKPRFVILITIDTLRQDALGVYGRDGGSPNIDRLAADGVVFDRAYSSAPWTLPAMAGILTGLSPWEHNVHSTGDSVPLGLPTLAERLRAAGYSSASFGRNFFLSASGAKGRGLGRGFDTRRLFPVEHRPRTATLVKLDGSPPWGYGLDVTTDELTDYALGWLDRTWDSPFFLWVHYFDPHMPYDPPTDFYPPATPHPKVGRYCSVRLLSEARNGNWAPSPAAMDWIRRLYQAEVRHVDANLGRLLDRCRELGVYEDALIVLSSDHGEEFFEHSGVGHGHSTHEELLRVPLIVKLPGADSFRSRVDTRVSTLSIPPTILGLSSVDFDQRDFPQPDLAEFLEPTSAPSGGDMPPRRPLYASAVIGSPARETVLFEDWKLVHELQWDRYELYNMKKDPGELSNVVAAHPEAAALGKALLRRRAVEATERRKRLGLRSGEVSRTEPRDLDLLRSLGYIQ